MSTKVILISIDGMRPEGALQCGNPFIKKLMESGTYTLQGQTVMPSVTLPCHTSMFYSLVPQRHGILTNTYTPPVRPVDGIVESLHKAGKTCGAFFNWEPIRHLWKTETMTYSSFIDSEVEPTSDELLTDAAIALIKRNQPDFLFLYMVETDNKGHRFGWMSKEYLEQISLAFENVKRIVDHVDGDCHVIVTTDHGGHSYTHGTDSPEDMTIPMFFLGKRFVPGQVLTEASILDIAPTVADLMDVEIPKDWLGQSRLPKNI
jgi:predicted AlkP superfamily pyrophosphatase or phosphodiesterase